MDGFRRDCFAQPPTPRSSLPGGSRKLYSCSPASPFIIYKSSELPRIALEQLNDLRKAGTLCDVTLLVVDADGEGVAAGMEKKTERLRAHRLVLAACSHYFKAMFTSEMAEAGKDEILIRNIDGSTLRTLVDFCYSGEVMINDSNVQQLLPAASLLQINEVQDVCSEFLKKQLHPSNCIGIRAFADSFGCRDLHKVAEKFMLDNFQEVINGEEFLQLTVDQLVEVIASDELNVKSDEQVYRAVMQWVQSDLDIRRQHLPTVLEHVRLATLSAKFLVTTVSDDPLIRSDMQCRDLVDEAKNFLLLPTERAEKQGVRSKPRRPSKYGQLLYAVGGWCSGDAIASVERMDPRTGEWRTVASMTKRRCGVGVAVLGDWLYAVGGHDGQKYLKCVERYDPLANQWSSDVTSTSTCRTSVGVAVHDNYLYAVGGQDGVSCLNVVERYDIIRNEWTVVAPMNSKRLGVSVSVLDGSLYAVGGADGNSPLNSVERYDPRINKWYNVRPMSARRKHLGTAVFNGHLYAVGGRGEQSELNTGERYDPVRNEWTSIVAMNSRRSGVGLAVVNDQLYAVGGFDGYSYLKSVEVYDCDVDSSAVRTTTGLAEDDGSVAEWRHAGCMSYRRLGGGLGVINVTTDAMAESNSVNASRLIDDYLGSDMYPGPSNSSRGIPFFDDLCI